MVSTRSRIAALIFVVFVVMGAACTGLSLTYSSALAGSQPDCMGTKFALAETDCTQPNLICPLALSPGLSVSSRVLSSSSVDFSKGSQLPIVKGYPLSLPSEISLASRVDLLINPIPFPQNISINLLKSSLTL